MSKRHFTLIITVLIALVMVLPALAQEDDSCEFVTVSGEVSFEDGEFVITDATGEEYIVAPASPFVAQNLSEGDLVTLTGCALPDEATIQALSLDVDVAADSDDTPEETESSDAAEDSGEEDAERGYFCDEPDFDHPAGSRLADEFEADYEDIMTAFCEDSYGFGEIMLAQMLADATGEDVATFLDGEHNWGQKARDAGLNPGELFSERVLGSPPWADNDWQPGPPDGVGGPPDGVGGPPDNVGPPDGVGGPPDGAGGRP